MVFTYIRFNSPLAYQYLFSPFHVGTKLKPSFITNLRPYKVSQSKLNITRTSNRLLYRVLHINAYLYFVNALSSSNIAFSLLMRPLDRGEMLADEQLALPTRGDGGGGDSPMIAHACSMLVHSSRKISHHYNSPSRTCSYVCRVEANDAPTAVAHDAQLLIRYAIYSPVFSPSSPPT